jgi:hypothetical protein
MHLLASAEGAPSEKPPQGVPAHWSWVAGSTTPTTVPPDSDYTHANYWGAVFRDESNTTPANTKIELRNCSFWILHQGESEWMKVANGPALGGGTFSPTYASGGPNPDVLTDFENGSDVVPAPGYIWHFWPDDSYQPVRQNEIREVLSNCQSRLALRDASVEDDRAAAGYLVHMGIDWRDPNDPGCADTNYVCVSFGVSRFETVETHWRNHTFHSLTAADLEAGVPLPPTSLFKLPDN